jgi:hypothetical protein
MSKNVAYMIVEKDTNRILDSEARRLVEKEVTFHSLFPARYVAENFRNRDLSDRQGNYYKIVEVEIVEFVNNQLTIACEEYEEEFNAPF